jgi:hypothetical protein
VYYHLIYQHRMLAYKVTNELYYVTSEPIKMYLSTRLSRTNKFTGAVMKM